MPSTGRPRAAAPTAGPAAGPSPPPTGLIALSPRAGPRFAWAQGNKSEGERRYQSAPEQWAASRDSTWIVAWAMPNRSRSSSVDDARTSADASGTATR